MIGYVYRHCIIIDGVEKSYVGKTIQEPQQRWRHGKGYKRHGEFYDDIQKYGWDAFDHFILEVVEASDEEQLKLLLSQKEKYYIDKYDSFYNGYNKNTGGDDNHIQSEKTIAKRSKSLQGKPLSEEHKKKVTKHLVHGKGSENSYARKIMCINTGRVFGSLAEAAEWCGLKSAAAICNYCKGKTSYAGKHPETKEKLTWKYVE